MYIQDLFRRSFHTLSMSSDDWHALDPAPGLPAAPAAVAPTPTATTAATAGVLQGTSYNLIHAWLHFCYVIPIVRA